MREHTPLLPRLHVLACALVFMLFTIQVQAQQALQALHNHVRPAVASGQAVPVGSLPSTQRMSLAIMLPLRNQPELTNFLDRLYDPTSPDYRHFLTVAQFTEQFGPTVQDYQTVVSFAKANGFRVTDTPPNRLLVDINGSVAQIEKAFHVRMNVYQHPTENRTFYSPDREPSLDLNVPVSHIAGLDNFSIPRPQLKRAPEGQAIHSNAGSGPGGAYLGGDMRAAYYGGTALTGSGQSVGLCEFDGYNMSDVTASFAGVSYNVPINNVLIDGASGGSDGDDGEQVLDIVQAIAMAPGMTQVRVYIAPGTTAIGVGDKDMFNKMATDNISKQIGCSWGWNPADSSSDDPIFQEFAAQGQNMFVASGDAGAYTGSNTTDSSYPAESVYVVAVGGTDLTTNGAGGPWQSETAWPDSGGGPSDDGFAIPSWQIGVANGSNGASTTIRNIPDVAAEGNFDNYLCDQGSCSGGWGGTSFAAPRWAGFLALVNQQAVANGSPTLGFVNPAIYTIGKGTNYNSDFHDITSGNNNNGNGKSYNAVTGYDLVTGWGSPNGQSLINALAGSSSPNFSLAASPSSLTITQGGAGGTSTITITSLNGFNAATTLSASGLPSGVTAAFSTNPVTPPANGTATSTLTLTASASATTGTATVTITGTSGSTNHTTNIALTVNAAASPNFTIGASPASVAVTQGGTGTSTVTITSQNSFSSATTLSTTGLPTGVTAGFSTNPVTPPANGSATSTLTFTASASATVGTATVTVTGTSGSLVHSTTIALTVNSSTGLQTATYNATLKAPACSGVGVGCDSGPSLLLGRDTLSGGNEPNQPNTINNSCADGTSGTYHSDESNDRLVIQTTDGSTLAPGKTVKVSATVWAYSSFTSDHLDLYYAANASSPTWVLIATLTPTVAGAQTLSANYTLPSGAASQAVRAQFRYQGSASSCTTGSYNDHDDLVFAVGAGTPGFTVAAAPSAVSVVQGANASSTITVTSVNGFNSATTLSLSALPAGVTASFSANPVTPPANGTATSTLTFTASATATTGTTNVTVTGTSGSLVQTATIALTVTTSGGGAQTATYNSTLKAPACMTVGSSCDSGPSLLLGKDTMSGGAEPNQPNTINNSCADGTSGTFHSDESNDRLMVASASGPLTHGNTVTVTATVWAWSTGSSDALDLYYAANANSPTWVLIGTIIPSAGGAQAISRTYTLPTGTLQAVRANFRYLGSASSCSTGAYDDHDDLVFAVN